MTERSHEKTAGTAIEGAAMDALPDDAALVLIDVQRGFDDPVLGHRNNPEAEGNCARLLECWRRAGRPIFHAQHLSDEPNSPLRAGQPGAEFKDIVRPRGDEQVVQKRVNSAFIGTDLETRLRRRGISTLVLAGLTTDHCVSTTARMAGNLGFDTYVVGDGDVRPRRSRRPAARRRGSTRPGACQPARRVRDRPGHGDDTGTLAEPRSRPEASR
jgi:isochorismate hydrolase